MVIFFYPFDAFSFKPNFFIKIMSFLSTLTEKFFCFIAQKKIIRDKLSITLQLSLLIRGVNSGIFKFVQKLLDIARVETGRWIGGSR